MEKANMNFALRAGGVACLLMLGWTPVASPLAESGGKLPVLFESADGLYGYRAADGRLQIPARYSTAGPFNRYGFAQVHNPGRGKFELIDTTGRRIVDLFPYDNGPDYFVEGVARFVENDKIGFVSEKGQIVIPARFAFAFPFERGRARVAQAVRKKKMGEHTMVCADAWGEIDRAGRLVIPYEIKIACP